MPLSLAIDTNNDLYLGADGSLAMVRDQDAVLQDCQTAAQSQLGEMVLAVDRGIPNFDVTWTGAPRIAQFEAYLRRAFTGVEGVLEVSELTTSRTANTLSYRAVIRTIYGTSTLIGAINA